MFAALTLAAATLFLGTASADDQSFSDLASARVYAASNINGEGLFFAETSFPALGMSINKIDLNIDGGGLSATAFYDSIDNSGYDGQVWISRSLGAGNPASFGTGSCGDREIRGPIQLGPLSAYEVDCDVSMVYQFNFNGNLYSVGAKYYGGITRDQLGGVVAALTPVGSGPALPGIAPWLGATEFTIRPTSIVPTGDGSGILAGRPKHYRAARSKLPRLKWSSWTATRATSSAALWLNDCRPYCAAGRMHPYPVKLVASRVRSGHFTRLRVTRNGRPRAPHVGLLGTYRLKFVSDAYYWNW